MTDARLPGRWLSDPTHDGLSDRAYRTFHNSLMYAAEQGTDGVLEKRALRWICPEGDVSGGRVEELLSAGLWIAEASGYRIAEWERTQSTHAQVEARRDQNRRNQRRAREKAKARTQEPESPTVSDDVSAHVSADDVGQDRRGQDRIDQPRAATQEGPELDDDARWRRQVMAGRGITNFDEVLDVLRRETSRPIPEVDGLLIVQTILDRATGHVRSPQAYVLKSIRQNWAEIQQQHDTAEVAA